MAWKKWLRPFREAFETALDALLFPFQRSHRDRVPFSEWLNVVQAHELDSWKGKGTRHNNFLNLEKSVRLLGLTAKELKNGKVLDVGAGPRSAVYYVKSNKAN